MPVQGHEQIPIALLAEQQVCKLVQSESDKATVRNQLRQ